MKKNELKQKLDYMSTKRNEFILMCEEEKEKGKYTIQFHSKETKRTR